MAHLAISLLGSFRVTLDGQPVTRFESDKARALLAYLAVEADRPHRRETLVGLLWPDQPERVARHNLSQSLLRLRQAIDDEKATPSFLLITRQTIQFNTASDHWLDVAVFESKLAAQVTGTLRLGFEERQGPQSLQETSCERCYVSAGHLNVEALHQAVELYQADFLAHFFLTDSDAFEEWTLFKRARLHLQMMEALAYLTRYHEERGEYKQALAYARRQIELDPLQEGAHRQVMRLLGLEGQRSAALVQYEACRRVLAEELGIEPSEDTKRLYRRIKFVPDIGRHNLPPQVTPFVGREAELREVAKRLANPDCRLLTLVGPGGIGKTRLAIQAAYKNRRAFLHGVCFVSLGSLRSTDFLVSTIADALQLHFHSEADPKEQLLDVLRGWEMLLVLDNFEHLIEGGVGLLIDILRTAPDMKLLVTSRERLNLYGETVFGVEGLEVPKETEIKSATGYSAVDLFLQSADRTQAGFKLASGELADVVRICRLVEGMPLGIELAASWVRALPCREIAAEIEQSLAFLSTSARGIPSRHRSMQAVFDHSWQLFSEAERKVARKLSVFRGPFQGEAAQTVAGATPAILKALVDKSFLNPDQEGRYDIHQLLRQYATEKLVETPREQEATRALHCKYYADFLHRRERALEGNQQQEAMAEIGAEVENIRAAWHCKKPEAIASSLQGLYLFYWARGWLHEGREAFERAARSIQDSGEESSLLLARLWTRLADFYSWLGIYDQAKTLLQKGIAILCTLQAHRELAFALETLGRLNYWLGNYTEARGQFQESLAICRQTGDQRGVAQALNSLATVICDELADYDRAQPLYEESLAIARQIGDQFGVANVLINQGAIAQELGDYAKATQLCQESLSIYREIDYHYGISASLRSLGQVAFLAGEYTTAKQLIEEGLDIDRETGNRNAIITSLSQLGRITCEMGGRGEAKQYFDEALQLALEIQALPPAMDVLIEVAKLFKEEGKGERALELLAFVFDQTTGEELKARARGIFSELEARFSPQVVAECCGRGRARTLEAVVAEILDGTCGSTL